MLNQGIFGIGAMFKAEDFATIPDHDEFPVRIKSLFVDFDGTLSHGDNYPKMGMGKVSGRGMDNSTFLSDPLSVNRSKFVTNW